MRRSIVLHLISLTAAVGMVAGGVLILDKTVEPLSLLPPEQTDILALPVSTEATAPQTTATSHTVITAATTFAGYTLRLSGDTLYVYPKGAVEPSESHNIAAQWLPEYDRILLQNGLYVATAAELRQLLEDYTS